MSDLILKGRVCDVDENEKNGKRFIFLENGRNSEQVSVPVTSDYAIGDDVELSVRNLNGVSAKTGKAWQFYATV